MDTYLAQYERGVPLSYDPIIGLPYPNEHAARLADPAKFDPDSFRRTAGGTIFGRIKVPETVGIIWGKLKGKAKPSDPPIVRALRFPTKNWTADEAKAWLSKQKIKYQRFEPATGGKQQDRKAAREEPIRLSQALEKGDFEIDREAGILKAVSVITRGAAKGHGFDIDDVMLGQVAAAINGKESGIRSHLGHPAGFGGGDGIMVRVGRFQEAKVDEKAGKVKADFAFGAYAENVPGKGNVRDYLLDLAEEDAAEVALSILFVPAEPEDREDEEGRNMPPAVRLKELLAVDWVDDPAANPGGLLSEGPGDAVSPQVKEETLMDPKVKAYLVKLGLMAEASDEEALAFLERLTDAQKAEIAALQKSKGEEPEPPLAGGEDEKVAQAVAKAVREALAREQKRREGVAQLAREYGMASEEADRLAADPTVTVEGAAKKVLEWLKKDRTPLRVHVGQDLDRETLGQAITDAICLRAGIPLYDEEEPFSQHQMREIRSRIRALEIEERCIASSGIAPRTILKTRKPHERALKMRNLPIRRMAAQYLRTIGVPGLDIMGDIQILMLAMRPRELRGQFRVEPRIAFAHSTSDFPLLLQDVLNKSLRARYVEKPKTWPIWVRPTTNVDFKQIKRIALSGVQDLVLKPEGAEVKYGTMSESRETYYLATYARGFKCTREMLINDDLDAFSRLPALHMDAAIRLEEDVVYLVLTGNAPLADGIPLFNPNPPGNNPVPVGHWNLLNVALTPAGLDSMRERIRVQPGPSPAPNTAGPILNLEPVYLLLPANLEGRGKRLMVSEYLPTALGGQMEANIWRAALTPVIQPRLDRADPEDWYVAADSDQIDTVEICFLEEEQTPVLAQETEFDTGDMKLSIRHTVAAKAIDHRGLAKSSGGESGETGSIPSEPPH